MTTALTLRVQRVRHRCQGSATATALAIDANGQAIPDAPRYAVIFPARRTPAEVQQGQWWRVVGDAKPVQYVVDGFQVLEHRLVAQAAELLRPSGEHIVQLLATSPAFPGIGEVKARRLWEALGERLYQCLEQADQASVAAIVGTELAGVLLAGWQAYGNADALRWFQRAGLELRLSHKVLEVYGAEAHAAIAADPYRLLAFGMSWPAADQLAREHFGLGLNDPRRLTAAVESVLYGTFDDGNTCCKRADVVRALGRLVGTTVVAAALDLAIESRVVLIREGRLHAQGPYLIERGVATALNRRLDVEMPLALPCEVAQMLERFEQEDAAFTGRADFALNAAQRAAVHAAARHPLTLITGGAGVGKTTVLKAVGRLLDSCGRTVYLMALSGRAAKRMAETTHRPAMTIAGFLRNVAREGVPDDAVLVIDEASMLDVLLAYRLLEAVPTSCRLVLIGDPFQLPPVGPGLTLHALIAVTRVPRVELTEVRRFGGEIAQGAQAVREGGWPAISDDPQAPLAFVPCAQADLAATVLQHYRQDPQRTQILTFTRERGPASAKVLNALCQEALGTNAPPLLVWCQERQRVEDSGLRLGDPVLCTRNLWDLGIQNGSLGRLEAIEETPHTLPDTEARLAGTVLAWVRWDDGERRPVTEEVLDALELGYAVTVHKAQGSQFPRVIVPVWAARNLDRTMLYTAITRATTQVLLVGDVQAARRAAEAEPHASRRHVALAGLLEERP
ncbi:AAA family ATPase [Cupriavidus necator]|uniref:AAA family ATPase n=1 Tax=Cupriavidus necator TaxID=106590 RepID=UPI00339D72C8